MKSLNLIKHLLKITSQKYPIDFVLYIGETAANEAIFTYLDNIEKHKSARVRILCPDSKLYTCTIGQKPTQAKYYLSEKDQVKTLLDSLANHS